MVHEVFGSCAVPFGAEADEPLQVSKERHERAGKCGNSSRNWGRRGSRNAKGWKAEGEIKKSHKKRMQETKRKNSKLEVSWHKKTCGTSPNREGWKPEEHCPKRRERDLIREYKATHEKIILCSCLREDTEGTAEEAEERDRTVQEEGAKSEKSLRKEGRENVEKAGKRVCFGVCSSLPLAMKLVRLLLFGRWWMCECEWLECVLFSVRVSN